MDSIAIIWRFIVIFNINIDVFLTIPIVYYFLPNMWSCLGYAFFPAPFFFFFPPHSCMHKLQVQSNPYTIFNTDCRDA